ncbi:Methanol dehydrogenase activator [bacterium HR20]|nr:Methanol dehydrogenase activator [bacterium HR20]
MKTSSGGAASVLKWETLERRPDGNFRIFDVEWVRRKHPETGASAEFVVLHTPVWVNVIPITPQGRVVMVRQYRHGADAVTLEFPGGVASASEEPATAAMRECVEETGYQGSADEIELLGVQLPNPAFMATRCYSFAWYGCQRRAVPQWDEHEIVETVELPLEQVDRLIAAGHIQHSIILAAWTLFRLRTKVVEHSRRL